MYNGVTLDLELWFVRQIQSSLHTVAAVVENIPKIWIEYLCKSCKGWKKTYCSFYFMWQWCTVLSSSVSDWSPLRVGGPTAVEMPKDAV